MNQLDAHNIVDIIVLEYSCDGKVNSDIIMIIVKM